MRPNRIKQRWAEGKASTMGWLSIASPFTAEILARQGFDAMCIDMQHGLVDYTDVWPMLQAIGQTETVPFVRVPANDPATLMRVLDAGAYGVIVPMVNTVEEAARAVAACRYPPVGSRSIGPVRAALYGGPDYPKHANDEMLVFGMIETKEGLANLDAIAAVPGLDGLYIGPNDLALALGLPPAGTNDSTDPTHLATCDRIREAAHRHGKRAAMHCYTAAFAKQAIGRGFDLVRVTSDVECLNAGLRAQVSALKA